MRVAHLIESDGPGGAERMVVYLAGEQRQNGTSAVAVLPAGGEGWLGRELAAVGVDVTTVRLKRAISPAFARQLARTLRDQRVSIVHSHEFSMAFYGAWAARLAGLPHIITMHGGRYYAGRLRRRVALSAAIRFSGGVVAVSDQLANHLARDLWLRRARIATIPNGVGFQAATDSTLRAELGLSDDQPLIVTVGNLYPVKGHTHVIEALARLTPTHPHMHLAIAGRGDLAPSLERQAKDSGLGSRVHLLGLREDVANVLAAGDLFVLPSLSEGMPMALLEAMFAARPIVATAVGDVPVALANGAAGMLVPSADVGALASAIARLLASPFEARRLGAAARARAEAEYGVGRMADRYGELYQRLLSESARSQDYKRKS